MRQFAPQRHKDHKDHKERQWVIVMMRLTWLVIYHLNAKD
jgi:hypothetical protein